MLNKEAIIGIIINHRGTFTSDHILSSQNLIFIHKPPLNQRLRGFERKVILFFFYFILGFVILPRFNPKAVEIECVASGFLLKFEMVAFFETRSLSRVRRIVFETLIGFNGRF